MSGPSKRQGETHRFVITSHAEGQFECYLTINEWDGQPMEIFIASAKQGSFVHGMMDTIAILVSRTLQGGLPLSGVCWSLMGLRFEPRGETDDPEIPQVSSLCDYIGRRLAMSLPESERLKLEQRIEKEKI